ncbi:AbrB family transcriptional regulator [Halomonas sp. QX-2]|uniref:AbrB family transcriptional regulator n=1 Tax=Vreelandella sedimenti TaxID=2729618 RepID=A0A7Z0NCD9_9GAMM|nr:AbrB family transcriptional regulator [Halomonas sedimenti]NYT74986.1 AbrB family transcriptional regulator [Halomonas sedimenti]
MKDSKKSSSVCRYSPRQGLRLTMLFLLCAAAGFVADSLQAPLAWMIGPMCAATAISLSGYAPYLHHSARGLGQLVVAAAVGLYFTPSALAQTISHLPAMVGIALLATLAGCVTAYLLIQLTAIDLATVLFSSIPGGPGEMAQLAEQKGGSAALVAIAQSLRIAMVVTIIPLSLAAMGAGTESFGVATNLPVVGPLVLLEVLTIATLAAYLFHRCGIVSPMFMGPLAASAILAGTGFYDFGFPRFVIYAGQLLLGASLGLSFTREIFRRAPRFLLVSTLMTGLLMAICAAMGYVASRLTSWDLPTMILATAPGSVTEMSITAENLGLGVAGVAAFQIVRLFIMVPLTPLLYRVASSRVMDM